MEAEMRKLLAMAMGVFALLAMATPATAAEVTRTPLPSTGTVSLPHPYPCGFDVRLDLVNNETLTRFIDNNGTLAKQVISGSSFGMFTNLPSGKTINVNLSGPAQFTFNSDGSITINADGPQGFVVPLLGLGSVPLTQFLVGSGHVVYRISPKTGITLVSKVGSFQDVCPMLS
jgi:hypothetical protein